jgi:hypothetical protein
MSDSATTPSVDEILKAMAQALASEQGCDAFHRLAARHEASVHDSLAPGTPTDNSVT